MNESNNEYLSILHKIVPILSHPMDQFKLWCEKDPSLPKIVAMNLATTNRNHGVLGRTVFIRQHDRDGIVFVTESCSQKYKDIKENPLVAATVLFPILVADGKYISRQARLNGTATEVSEKEKEKFYNEETLSTKIRCKICECGTPVDWTELKKRHDQTLENFKNGLELLKRNESYTAFRIEPTVVEFYESEKENCIADRLIYTKDKSGDWSYNRVCT